MLVLKIRKERRVSCVFCWQRTSAPCPGPALLEKNNYSADAVYDGEEALAYLEGGNYDGVFLDIMMPKVDGLEVLRRLRQQGNPIPVLLLTAKSEVEDKVTGLDMGPTTTSPSPFPPPSSWPASGP